MFNNVAIAARHTVEKLHKVFPDKPDLARVMIIDWDVHHGNGTEEIFYNDKDVLYVSTHLYGDKRFYPYTGGIDKFVLTSHPLFLSSLQNWCGRCRGSKY